MPRYRHKSKLFENNYLIIFFLIICVSAGYAYITSTIEITGLTHLPKNTWDVHFENVKILSNTVSSQLPTLTNNDTVATFTPVLNIPGDQYIFTMDIVNDGTIDAMVSEVVKTSLTAIQEKYTDFNVNYITGQEINQNDVLKAGESIPIMVGLIYKKDIGLDDLPESDENLSLSVSIDYVQADTNANSVTLGLNFENDSWDKIVENVRFGLGSYYELGATKEVDLGELGVHTVRVANTSTPDECLSSSFSQTACGFVLEFTDIVKSEEMNFSNTSSGGWPKTQLHTYANSEFLNILPKDLQKNIIDTYVVSGYGYSDFHNHTSTDKIYLLSTNEVLGGRLSDDKAASQTRQLDYYKSIGVSESNYLFSKKHDSSNIENAWWLRSASYKDSSSYYAIGSGSTSIITYNPTSSIGFSPAFRIG